MAMDSVCIHATEEAGPDPGDSFRKHRVETDITNFALMGNTEKEYSVPYELLVCHDEERIHGI